MSHSEECKVNQLSGVKGSIVLLNYGALWLQEVINFEFHESVFKKCNISWPQQPRTGKALKIQLDIS